MNRIHQLPDDLITRIAAGEVVERPASVVKELLENSLDAGATDVSVSLEGAGRSLIRVSDNGCGMTKGDAALALKRHATSKISRFEDLESIGTFGFRGEALPSIASVSKLRLVTRSADEDVGWEILVEGGKIVKESPLARDVGTTIEVRDLFFNTPARFKFLKSDATERSQCLRTIEEVVFVSPQVSFHVQSEKGKPVVYRGSSAGSDPEKIGVLMDRVIQTWGTKWAKGFDAVALQGPQFSVRGLVSNQGFHQATPRTQVLFVNNRAVANRRLTRAVYDAYVGQLPSLRHPAWVLFLDVNPKAVDVNVHPAKREVKIAFENEIYGFVVSAVKQALWKTQSVPVEITTESPGAMPSLLREAPARAPYERVPFESGGSSSGFSPLMDLKRNIQEQGQTEFLGFKEQQLFAVAQVRNTFIIAQSGDSLMIVDQHAAAEKVLYEQLLQNLHSPNPAIQMMLVPFSWEVSLALQALLSDKVTLLKAMGFIIEPFGGNTFLVKGYPSILGEKFDLHSLLDSVSDVMAEPLDPKGGLERNFEHRLAAMTACKASVKAGDPLDLKACQFILHELLKCEAPLTCPHGRPTVIRLSFSELERRFRRI